MSSHPHPLSALDKSSFAYTTISKRLPEILAKIVDSCHRQITNLEKTNGKEGAADGVAVVSKISRLRSRVMTDKCLEEIEDSFVDVEDWKNSMSLQTKEMGNTPSWFTAPWLYVECYMYRYLYHCLIESKFMQDFDPFMDMKNESYESSRNGMEDLSTFFISTLETVNKENMQQLFTDFLKISLWANRNDLSLSCGSTTDSSAVNPHQSLDNFQQFILSDQSNQIWQHLTNLKTSKIRVDIVLDNCGMEFFSDLVLADFLLTTQLAHQVVFYPKPIPWFVSDVMPRDITILLDKLAQSDNENMRACGERWRGRLDANEFRIEDDASLIKFFTLANPYSDMPHVAPQLHKQLSTSSLIIFKGDLNYRKLVGDLNWDTTTSFRDALMGFHPAPLCSLRTLKADVVVGLEDGQADKVEQLDTDWLTTGKYAVIQSLI